MTKHRKFLVFSGIAQVLVILAETDVIHFLKTFFCLEG